MGLISAGTTIFDAGAVSGGGSLTFIKKLTASSSSTLSFVDGSASVVLDGTYKEYLFITMTKLLEFIPNQFSKNNNLFFRKMFFKISL